MMSPKAASWVLRSQRVVTPDGVSPRSIHINGEKIVSVRSHNSAPAGVRVVDAGDAVILPGLVDTHVHINEPGRTEWEGFETATRAAAAGGVTTLVEMPLNAIPATVTVESLKVKVESTRGRLSVDTAFWGGVVPGNTSELEPLWNAGVLGFKCFLVPSGVPEFANVTETDLRKAMPVLARLGAPLLVHAELPGPIEAAAEIETCVAWDGRAYRCYLESRPRAAENEAIALMIRLCREFRTRVHIVHLSSSDALSMLGEARTAGLPVTVETCPHYLHFAAEDIPDGACALKCAPPIRERSNNEALWGALLGGRIDLVATDHSPCPPAMKQLEAGDFASAWGGISSLQLGASVVWTGLGKRGGGLDHLARWMSEAPARLAALDHRKGAIAPGRDADLVIFRPDDDYVVDPARLLHRHKVTPYAGERLRGVIERTYLRGDVVYEGGQMIGTPRGTVLTRSGTR
jgi:allantoinase